MVPRPFSFRSEIESQPYVRHPPFCASSPLRSTLTNFFYQVNLNLTPKEHFARDAPHFRPIEKEHKPNVDKTFMRQLSALLRVTFPHWTSKEVATLCLHSFFLVLRTILSVYVARLDGRIVRDIVSADGVGFLKGLGWWFALAVPSTYTNSMVSTLLQLFFLGGQAC